MKTINIEHLLAVLLMVFIADFFGSCVNEGTGNLNKYDGVYEGEQDLLDNRLGGLGITATVDSTYITVETRNIQLGGSPIATFNARLEGNKIISSQIKGEIKGTGAPGKTYLYMDMILPEYYIAYLGGPPDQMVLVKKY